MSSRHARLPLFITALALLAAPACDDNNDGWSSSAAPENAASVASTEKAAPEAGHAHAHADPDALSAAPGAVGTQDHHIELTVDAKAWPDGAQMATSLSKMLTTADQTLQETPHGLDADAGALFGGFLSADNPLYITRSLGGGREYVFFAGGASDEAIHIQVFNDEGQLVAQDKIKNSAPRIVYRPAKSGQFRLELSLGSGGKATFATMGIAVEGGYRVSKQRMQGVFQHLLDRAGEARKSAMEAGGGDVTFVKGGGDWSINATILLPRESIRQRGIGIPANHTGIFLAICHDKTFDIDGEVVLEDGKGEATDTKWKDDAKDGEPILNIEPTAAERTVNFAVALATANEWTLATSVILMGAPK